VPATTPTPAVPSRPTPPALTLAPSVDGLASPLYVGAANDDRSRLFVIEQAGRIRIVRDGRLVDRPFLDISDRITSGGERGLLGLAFSPSFATDGRFYVDFTDGDGNTVVAEYRTSTGDPDLGDPSSERVLVRIDQPFPNHNGGGLAVDRNGLLWIATGDGGSAGDPQGNGQRLDTLLGKLLRIDPRPSGGAPYAIPADNPFVGRPDARPEIWAYGLRNPWRFSFDRATGDLWIGDVGQDAWEEIDHVPAGAPGGLDFGWNRMEGRHCYEPATGCDTSGLTLPVAEYSHAEGCAVTGGFVYRGAALPALVGTYVYGDYCSGRIWGLAASGGDTTPTILDDSGRAISSFGEDAAGELYLTDLGGALLRLVPAGG
jgi:glucose/arabinose dehydrogenase